MAGDWASAWVAQRARPWASAKDRASSVPAGQRRRPGTPRPSRATREADFKAQNDLPLARIKRIMKSDEDVRMISAEAPVVLARACELFVLELTLRAAKGQENEKVITRADVVAAIKNAATMDFLRGVVDPSMAPSADEIAAAEEEDL